MQHDDEVRAASRTEFDRWCGELIDYFEELGGQVTLPDLYRHIEAKPRRELRGKWQERVRFTIYEASSDSDIWKGERDLFRRVGTKRSGIWALRLTEALAPGGPDHFDEDVAPSVPPEKRRYVRDIYLRNQRLAVRLKKARNFTCERCGLRPTWSTIKGTPYVEAHHIVPLGESGFDDERNLIVVCADCHRFLHHAADRTAEATRLAKQRGITAS